MVVASAADQWHRRYNESPNGKPSQRHPNHEWKRNRSNTAIDWSKDNTPTHAHSIE